MPIYDRSPAESYREIDRWRDGVGWLAHPDEDGRRASHAVRDGNGGVWVFDPVDAPGIDDLLAEFGEVAGVAVLSSYHARDADSIAARHDVAVHTPRWMDRVADLVDAPVERFATTLADTDFRVRKSESLGLWQEAVAYRERDGTLYVPDLLGSAPGYAVGDERVGVVLSHRLTPPRELIGDLHPERVLFGHGEGVSEDAGAALTAALDGARRGFPRAVIEGFGPSFRSLVSAMR